MKILYLIVARAGSKGVPGKNLRRLGGLSLVAWKALSARQARYPGRLVISTEDAEIQQEARRHGVEVPFTRPLELASDTASSAGVISHAMDWVEREGKDRFDAVMLLEPSSPFTRPEDLNGAVDLMRARDANVVVGMRDMEVSSTFVGTRGEDRSIGPIVTKMRGLAGTSRQDMAPEWTMNGGLYLFRWEYFKQHGSIYDDTERSFGYLMPEAYSLEIDNMFHLHLAEFLLERGHIDLTIWTGVKHA